METAAGIWKMIPRQLVAILRGVEPKDVGDITKRLLEAGFGGVEVPLNSPDPFRSIELAVRARDATGMPGSVIGAGTVYAVEDVVRVASSGGQLVVSPNCDPEVIHKTIATNMISMPGVFTATEARSAWIAGATALKFFPASVLGPGGIKAIRAVLPLDLDVCAVGGVTPKDFPEYVKSGITAFGLGSCLYRPGMRAAEVAKLAVITVTAFDSAIAGS